MWNLFRRSLLNKEAKDITGDTWFNITSLPDEAKQAVLDRGPLRFTAELAGVVTLIHFWDYSSQDSVEDLSYMHTWWELYTSPHFLIIGVHAPQYEFGRDADKVESAVLRFHLDYPVVSDPTHTTWRRYSNTVWPRKIIVDAHGVVRFDHRGKGGHEALETKLHELLETAKEKGQVVSPGNNVITPTLLFTREALGARHFPLSPLTDPAQYHISSKLALHDVALSGWWIMTESELQSGPLDDDQACSIHFWGSGCSAAMRGVGDTGASIQVFIDNKKIEEDIHVGEDTDYILASGLSTGAHHLTIVPVKGSLAISSVSFS